MVSALGARRRPQGRGDDRRDHAPRQGAADGGVKEKLLAAHRSGLKTIIVPKDNEKDLADIPKNVLDSLDVYMVESMDEVLKIALAEPLGDRCGRPGGANRRRLHDGVALIALVRVRGFASSQAADPPSGTRPRGSAARASRSRIPLKMLEAVRHQRRRRSAIPADGIPHVALVGRSNVGKSTVINALVRSPLARTSAAAGKTRLANLYRVTVDGGAEAPVAGACIWPTCPDTDTRAAAATRSTELARIAASYFEDAMPRGGNRVDRAVSRGRCPAPGRRAAPGARAGRRGRRLAGRDRTRRASWSPRKSTSCRALSARRTSKNWNGNSEWLPCRSRLEAAKDWTICGD